MTDDQPLDLDAVAADDAALDALRADAGDDAALVLLRELLLDVEQDLPHVPVGHGSTVMRLAAPPPGRRLVRGSALVATLAAGTVSLGGVAAASTLAPAGSPLHGLGEAFRSAATAVLGAVSPPDAPARPAAVVPTPTASPSAAGTTTTTAVTPVAPRAATPGAQVSAASRSRAAARQVDQLLDDAARLLKTGRAAAATGRLDLAERKLADVLPADRADLPQRLADLRAQAGAATAAKPGPKQDPPGKAKSKEKGKSQAPARAPKGAPKQQQRKKSGGQAPKEDKPKGGSLLAQSSSDASMNPRA